MKFNVLNKEICLAKDSHCKVCGDRAYWAKFIIDPNTSSDAGKRPEDDKGQLIIQSSLFHQKSPTLNVTSTNGTPTMVPTTSVKYINISNISNCGNHYYVGYMISNHNWKQKCMIDPSSKVNCVDYDWIVYFDTPAWNYNLQSCSN